jgi:predicted methyltransferase
MGTNAALVIQIEAARFATDEKPESFPMRIFASLAAVAALVLSVPAAADPALDAVLASSHRDADRVRDQYRHPAETLAFFDVRPGMTVVDFWPAGGWFTRVLVPYLGPQGTYVGLNPLVEDGDSPYFQALRNYADSLPAQAQDWVPQGGARVLGANVGSIPEGLHGTADRVLIFREIHNMRRLGWFHDVAVAARNLLKPDGLLGIEQQRAHADAPASYILGDNGYQREGDVIALFEAYGFELVARSEINANPRDPANWPQGVWTLPPGYRGTPAENTARRAELDAIGESDRMTLLFRKRP